MSNPEQFQRFSGKWPVRAWVLYEHPDGNWVAALRGKLVPDWKTEMGSFEQVLECVSQEHIRMGLPIIVKPISTAPTDSAA
jgi:hypothetical protein